VTLTGIHTALVTPFDADGSVDVVALDRLVDRQLEAGIHGVVACGTTGETPTLTLDECELVIGRVRERVAGRVPVTAGVGTNATASTVARCERAAALGADVGLLVLPYYNKPNPSGMRAHIEAAAAVGLPLMLYHVPGRTGQRVPPELLAQLGEVPGVVAFKEATGDLRYGGDLLVRTQHPVFSGDDFSFLGLLALGALGCVSVLSNVAPAATVAIFEDQRAGRAGEAAAAMQRLWALTSFLFSDTNPVPCKAALAELGLCRADARLPLASWSGPSPRAMLGALGLT
jgi:4-hydroxy-tetrahydrodipicolinate synthase